jgi:unsaturated rhamnogalacturonyl hydrolase
MNDMKWCSNRKTGMWVVLLCVSAQAGAQLQTSVDVVRRVAGYITRNTSYTFIDERSKATYNSAAQVPAGAEPKVSSIYNRWEYSNGVVALGMMELAATLGDTSLEHYAGRNFRFVFDNLPYFSARYAANPKTEFYNLLRMDRLDDCGALGAALVRYNQLHPDERFQAYISKAAAFVSQKQDRLPDGTLCRKAPRPMTLWADDLFMSVPFLAGMGKVTGKPAYTDDAIRQVLQFNQYLYDAPSGLYFHNWYSDVEMNGVAHWLRCNGWLAMAQADLLSQLPHQHPLRKELTKFLLRQISGFARYQDTSGLWHQLIDKPDSYLETSGTAMFVYAVAKAVNEKWIPTTYLAIAEAGWQGLMRKVTADGQVQDVCIGTGMRDNLSFYYSRPVKLNDFHVAGAFLLAGSEMIKAYNNKTVTTKSD